MKKLIRYRLPVSQRFPKGHPRDGEETQFIEKIENAINGCSYCFGECDTCSKLHTIRANYPLWEKRMKKVQAGEAVIELYYWEGKPYHSKQIVFATLNKDSGCGMQKLIFPKNELIKPVEINEWYGDNSDYEVSELAENDGLSLEDFKAWFKNYDLSKPLVIIQFTKFRY